MFPKWFPIRYTLKELDKIEFCKRKLESVYVSPFEKFAYWKTMRIIEKQEYDKENMHDLKERRSYSDEN